MKTIQEIKTEFDDSVLRSNFIWGYSLCILLEHCLIREDYQAPQLLSTQIVLSKDGEEMAMALRKKFPEVPEADLKLALFVKLYCYDLFIDLQKTSMLEIENAISQDITNGSIKYPWVFDRLLYDRFFENFPNPNHQRALSYEETLILLENSPQGVFQVQDFIVGPFGILRSNFKRELLPTTSAPLWHCPDPSCEKLHTSQLTTGDSLISKLMTDLSMNCVQRYGEKEYAWQAFYNEIAFEFNYYDDQNLSSFPWLLGNTFSEAEIRNIFCHILKIHSSDIRQRLPQTKTLKNIFTDSPEKTVSKLSKPECFQLILLTSDEHIISSIESLIEEKNIKIPPTEIRSPRYFRGSSWDRTTWECSQFGVRSTPSRSNIGITRLKQLIYKVYSGEEKRAQLKWALRRSTSEDLHERLDHYIFSQDPREIIRELILSDPGHLESAFKILRFGKFSFPKTTEDEHSLISKILWKLDFNINSYPDSQEKFWKRHSNFLDVARTYSDYNENDKETIRSASANFFISLEEILDYSLSFITWVLLSDHYGSTRFTCDLDEARQFMASALSQASVESVNDSEPIEYNPNGVNTLYPLIAGFRLLGNFCQKLLEKDSPENKRPINEFPRFHGKTALQIFSFLNKILLFDLKETSILRVLEALREITSELEIANVSNVRNRLQHSRKSDEFPKQNEIDQACGAISSVVTKMEKSGICPLVYFRHNSSADSYDRSSITLQDYKGRNLVFHRPSEFSSSTKVGIKGAVIITPWLHLKNSSEPLYFAFVESSDYLMMLKDFPKRRFVEE